MDTRSVLPARAVPRRSFVSAHRPLNSARDHLASRAFSSRPASPDGADALLLRNPQDADELAVALQRLLADLSLRATIGSNASQTAALFLWDHHAEDIHRLLRDAAVHRA
jgi:hypothetical protein